MSRPKSDPAVRFWSKVERRGPEECWPWLGAVRGGGSQKRGAFWTGTRMGEAVRWLWESIHGPEGMEGMQVMHSCDNPICMNPAHLSLGTAADNVRDMFAKGRAYQQTNPGKLCDIYHRLVERMRADPGLQVRGEQHHKARLTDAQVEEIRNSSGSYSELGRKYGVWPSTIQRIQRRQIRRGELPVGAYGCQ